MTDGQIVEAASRMYHEFGFDGLVGWHYYNEPLMARQRMRRLMDGILDAAANARFVLWTNGTPIRADADLSGFALVVISDYGAVSNARKWSHLPNVMVQDQSFDDRINSHRGPICLNSCRRPDVELPFDYYGNLHLCCQAWRHSQAIGNIHSDGLPELLTRFSDLRRQAASGGAGTPQMCRNCTGRISSDELVLPQVRDDRLSKGLVT
jgi:hypothetical protein